MSPVSGFQLREMKTHLSSQTVELTLRRSKVRW